MSDARAFIARWSAAGGAEHANAQQFFLELCDLLRRVFAERQVVSADIVEVRPLPPSNQTEFLAARLAYKLIAYAQLR